MFRRSIYLAALQFALLLAITASFSNIHARAQSLGSAGTINGVVTDPNGAVVPNASITISNPITGYKRTAAADDAGTFRLADIPPNNYQLMVSANGFTTAQQSVSVRTSVPISLNIPLAIGGVAGETVNVTDIGASDVLENIPTAHTDIDRTQINRLPTSSPGNGLSDVVTLAAPGVVADSNGFFHPLGDHAQSTISLDNQPISDQQSKAFSTQVPTNIIQSLEVTTGATPAEFGDKTSLVITAITRSGLNQKKPTGNFASEYGTFGTTHNEAALAFGNARAGNFSAFNFERSGRFLDAPELAVLHDRGTSGSIFNRFDYQLSGNDTLHFNLFLARNKFEIANQFDQQAAGQDQRQLVHTVNVAPGLVHVFSPTTVLTLNPFYRLDNVKYYPSGNRFNDSPQTFDQSRRLNSTGIKADVAYVKGRHNAKFGVQFQHTFLTEDFKFGITDPNFNPATIDDGSGNQIDNPNFLPGLVPFDLTRGGQLFKFRGHTDVKQEALFAQDAITLRNLTLSLGLRFDNYDGLTHGHALEPRLGASYLFNPTKTVLRASYTRTFETPYNENLVLSSATGAGGLANGILGDASNQSLQPGRRNQFNFGLEQGVGKYVVIDADYFFKFTNNAFDFNALLNTPLTFPISWSKAKIDGLSLRVNLTNYKNFSAFFVGGHSRARFFPPESGGLFFNSDLPTGVFRIDHDQAFQQTTQLQYQFNQLKGIAPYAALTWRYDSGVVSGAVTDYATALGFTPDQQQQIGLFCGNTFATLNSPITTCTDARRGAIRVRIPVDGTENDDHNPPRIAPRNLFDFSVGTDNLFRTERMRVTLRLTGVNITNRQVLYNFLSTFSGTHFVTPRSFQGRIGVDF